MDISESEDNISSRRDTPFVVPFSTGVNEISVGSSRAHYKVSQITLRLRGEVGKKMETEYEWIYTSKFCIQIRNIRHHGHIRNSIVCKKLYQTLLTDGQFKLNLTGVL